MLIQKTLKVGLTGGIGAGKSSVAKIFSSLQVPVYNSDIEAKRLMQHNPLIVAKLIEVFGTKTYTAEGTLNRAYLAHLVFENKDRLTMLNSIVHPVLKEDARLWFERQNCAYAIQEAAILYESKMDAYLDKVIVVYANEDIRIDRVIQRDNISKHDVISRMRSQMNPDEQIDKADYIIYNNDNNDMVSQVLTIHNSLLAL